MWSQRKKCHKLKIEKKIGIFVELSLSLSVDIIAVDMPGVFNEYDSTDDMMLVVYVCIWNLCSIYKLNVNDNNSGTGKKRRNEDIWEIFAWCTVACDVICVCRKNWVFMMLPQDEHTHTRRHRHRLPYSSTIKRQIISCTFVVSSLFIRDYCNKMLGWLVFFVLSVDVFYSFVMHISVIARDVDLMGTRAAQRQCPYINCSYSQAQWKVSIEKFQSYGSEYVQVNYMALWYAFKIVLCSLFAFFSYYSLASYPVSLLLCTCAFSLYFFLLFSSFSSISFHFFNWHWLNHTDFRGKKGKVNMTRTIEEQLCRKEREKSLWKRYVHMSNAQKTNQI